MGVGPPSGSSEGSCLAGGLPTDWEGDSPVNTRLASAPESRSLRSASGFARKHPLSDRRDLTEKDFARIAAVVEEIVYDGLKLR
jgi:hypothetical protein